MAVRRFATQRVCFTECLLFFFFFFFSGTSSSPHENSVNHGHHSANSHSLPPKCAEMVSALSRFSSATSSVGLSTEKKKCFIPLTPQQFISTGIFNGLKSMSYILSVYLFDVVERPTPLPLLRSF